MDDRVFSRREIIIYRLVKWLIWVPAAGLSVLLFLLFLANLFDSGNLAEKRRNERTALVETGKFVSRHVEMHGTLPGEFQLEQFVRGAHFGRFFQPSVERERPDDGHFDFPAWRGGKNFAISNWNGDFHDYYDSATGRTNLDEQTHTAFWINDSFFILGFAGLFGMPVIATFLAARKIRKRRTGSEPT